MKVYVEYRYYMYEGCTEPEKVFDSKEQAEKWQSEETNREYKELEIE